MTAAIRIGRREMWIGSDGHGTRILRDGLLGFALGVSWKRQPKKDEE